MILILPGSALTENLARVSDHVRFQWQSKLPESAAFTCYFVRNKKLEYNNQWSVAESAFLKAGELFRIDWFAFCWMADRFQPLY